MALVTLAKKRMTLSGHDPLSVHACPLLQASSHHVAGEPPPSLLLLLLLLWLLVWPPFPSSPCESCCCRATSKHIYAQHAAVPSSYL
jgi:hypothetical protein